MEKYIYTVVLLLTGIMLVHAQRMLPGQKGLEVNAGALSDDHPGRNYYLNIAMTVNSKGGNYQLWGVEYMRRNHRYGSLRIPQETYLAEGGYSLYLLGDTRKNITLNTALTGVAGYETINRGESLLYDGAEILNEEGFVYGLGGRLTLETYLSDRFVLLLTGRSKLLWGTSLEQIRPSAGVGLRFNF